MIALDRKLWGKPPETLLKYKDSADSVLEAVITKDRPRILVTWQTDWVLGEITTGRGKKLRERKRGLSGAYPAILGITKGERCS